MRRWSSICTSETGSPRAGLRNGSQSFGHRLRAGLHRLVRIGQFVSRPPFRPHVVHDQRPPHACDRAFREAEPGVRAGDEDQPGVRPRRGARDRRAVGAQQVGAPRLAARLGREIEEIDQHGEQLGAGTWRRARRRRGTPLWFRGRKRRAWHCASPAGPLCRRSPAGRRAGGAPDRTARREAGARASSGGTACPPAARRPARRGRSRVLRQARAGSRGVRRLS